MPRENLVGCTLVSDSGEITVDSGGANEYQSTRLLRRSSRADRAASVVHTIAGSRPPAPAPDRGNDAFSPLTGRAIVGKVGGAKP